MDKAKMTIMQFSNALAQNFQKSSIVPLVKEYIQAVEENNKSWKFSLNSKKDKNIMLKEWIVFEMFLLGQEMLACFVGGMVGAILGGGIFISTLYFGLLGLVGGALGGLV